MKQALIKLYQAFTHLIRPDDYKGQWYEWVTNQGAHGSIVGSSLFVLFILIAKNPIVAWIATVLFYMIFWEWKIQKDTTTDSLMDTANVAAGAGMLAILFYYIPVAVFWSAWVSLALALAAWLTILVIGILRRL